MREDPSKTKTYWVACSPGDPDQTKKEMGWMEIQPDQLTEAPVEFVCNA